MTETHAPSNVREREVEDPFKRRVTVTANSQVGCPTMRFNEGDQGKQSRLQGKPHSHLKLDIPPRSVPQHGTLFYLSSIPTKAKYDLHTPFSFLQKVKVHATSLPVRHPAHSEVLRSAMERSCLGRLMAQSGERDPVVVDSLRRDHRWLWCVREYSFSPPVWMSFLTWRTSLVATRRKRSGFVLCKSVGLLAIILSSHNVNICHLQ